MSSVCDYWKDQPEGRFTDRCLADHIMAGLRERLDLLENETIMVTWQDGTNDRAVYRPTEHSERGGYWKARMVEWNDEPIEWVKNETTRRLERVVVAS